MLILPKQFDNLAMSPYTSSHTHMATHEHTRAFVVLLTPISDYILIHLRCVIWSIILTIYSTEICKQTMTMWSRNVNELAFVMLSSLTSSCDDRFRGAHASSDWFRDASWCGAEAFSRSRSQSLTSKVPRRPFTLTRMTYLGENDALPASMNQ